MPSRVGQRLLQSIQQLRLGIRSDPSMTHLSRQVVTLFLSRRLSLYLFSCVVFQHFSSSAEADEAASALEALNIKVELVAGTA